MNDNDKVETLAAIESVPEPFLVPDVAPFGASKTDVWHFLRDLVQDGQLTHGDDGYRRI